MPVSSLYGGSGSTGGSGSDTLHDLLPDSPSSNHENRAVKLALELALLQGGTAGGNSGGSSSSLTDLPPPPPPPSLTQQVQGGGGGGGGGGQGQGGQGGQGQPPPPLHLLGNTSALVGGSLEDLKMRRSQNMTECVPVPSSEHVAEIVGRQGCKIKALRAKTNTYIKTPVRGDEPVFVVTGRKEDVALAKREILSAAEHFSQIRASRKNQINSTLAFGQMVANSPGQTTTQVRVPYRVVGLVVGPKGATIKRIQQTTHTYIVTPSRDKEPVFEVTGLPENVDAARKEIEAHIAIRTGSGFLGGELLANEGGNNFDLGSGITDNFSGYDASVTTYPPGRSVSPHNSSSILNNDHFTASLTNKTLQHLLDEQHQSNGININSSASLMHRGHPAATSVWSNGTDSHDSGIGHSPPFDSLGSTNGGGLLMGNMHHGGGGSVITPSGNNHIQAPNTNQVDDKMAGIWGELNKVLGNLDINGGGLENNNHSGKPFLNVGSRSSVDLGTLGSLGNNNIINSPSSCSSAASSSGHRPSLDLGQPSVSFTAMTNSTSSPPEDADQSNNEDFVDEPSKSVFTN